MKKIAVWILYLSAIGFIASCARGISPEQAANGKAKCGRTYIK